MVVNLLDARDGLGSDNCCLSRSLFGDDAAKEHDAVMHSDGERNRTPISLFDRRENTVSDVAVVSRRIWHIAGKVCDSVQQVGACHDADHLISA